MGPTLDGFGVVDIGEPRTERNLTSLEIENNELKTELRLLKEFNKQLEEELEEVYEELRNMRTGVSYESGTNTWEPDSQNVVIGYGTGAANSRGTGMASTGGVAVSGTAMPHAAYGVINAMMNTQKQRQTAMEVELLKQEYEKTIREMAEKQETYSRKAFDMIEELNWPEVKEQHLEVLRGGPRGG